MNPDRHESPIAPVIPGGRRQRHRAQVAIVAAVAVFAIAAGIGLASKGAGPEPTDSPLVGRPSTGIPAPTTAAAPSIGETLPPPTQAAGLGCPPVRPGKPEELLLASNVGDTTAKPGIGGRSGVGSNSPPWPGPKTADGWPVPPVAAAVGLPGGALDVLPASADCLRHVVAEYEPADATLKGPFPVPFRSFDLQPLQSRAQLGVMPAGDWVLRVVADFSSGVAGQADGAVAEAYFRVVSGDARDGPLPTPETPPSVPCAPITTADGVPDVRLVIGGGAPIAGLGVGEGTQIPVDAPLSQPIELRVDGDRCAHGWTIEVTAPDGSSSSEGQDNPANDPFLYSQNRWRVTYLSVGQVLVHAQLHFNADATVDRWWTLAVTGPGLPAVRLTGPDGRQVLTAADPCSTSWSFDTGSSGSAMCGETSALRLPAPLLVAAGRPVRMVARGWSITGWNGSCGTLGTARTTTGLVFGPPDFTPTDGCDLGGVIDAGAAIFLPRTGEPVVQATVTLTRGGTQITTMVYGWMEVGP
jgi:hypothetical protein